MLIKDESCVAEQTVLRYQNNNIADLLGSDWYGIMLLSPKGKAIIDTYFDVSHHVDNEVILDFVNNSVSYEFLQNGIDKTFTYRDRYYYVYPIRHTEKKYMVFFLFYREKSPFAEHDIIWYRTYAKTGYQRVLLENELVQVKNYNNTILENSDCAIAVINNEYKVISSNAEGEAYFGKKTLDVESFENSSALLQAIDDVLVGGKNSCRLDINYSSKAGSPGKSRLNVRISPLATSKGIVSAVVVIATNVTNINSLIRIEDRKNSYKDTVNIFRNFLRDIRSPIMNIQGCFELLKNCFEPESEQSKLISFIYDETERMERACSDFDAFQAATEDESTEKVSLTALIKNCVTISQRKCGLRKVEIKSHVTNEPIYVKGNTGELYMAFITLMDGLLGLIQDSGSIEISSTPAVGHEKISLNFVCRYDSTDISPNDLIDTLVSDMVKNNNGTINKANNLTDSSVLCTICLPIC